MLFKEIITLYSEDHTKYIGALCGRLCMYKPLFLEWLKQNV
jgi:hypothetical protein